MQVSTKRERGTRSECDEAPNANDAAAAPRRFRVRRHYFIPGDIVWIRPAGLPYWPAEVTVSDDAANTVTASLYDPPVSHREPPRHCVTATSGKVYFFDRLATPEELELCIEGRLQRGSHNVSAYEAEFHRAVLHANRLVRTVLSAERLRPFSVCGVGVVHSLMRTHIAAPRQPNTGRFEPQTAVIRLRSGLENAVRDLRGFEFIWVLFHFSYAVAEAANTNGTPQLHEEGEEEKDKEEKEKDNSPLKQQEQHRRQGADRSLGFKTMLVPPRDCELRGVFATRSPHRPNFIGMSCVRLVAVRGLEVHIADHDLLHGTPVLDIKPYLPFCDAYPNAKAGWVEALDESGRGGADHKYSAQRLQVDRIFETQEEEKEKEETTPATKLSTE